MQRALGASTTFFLFAFLFVGVLDVAPAGAWRREFRGTDTGADAEASAVAVDTAGDVVAAGQVTNLGTGTAFTVAKLDGDTGAQLWRTEINSVGTMFSRATAVAVDAVGDVVAAGRLENVVDDPEFVVVKLAGATGAELWRYEINGGVGTSGLANAVTVDASGDVVAAGSINLLFGASTFTVVKLADATGAQLWRKDLAGDAPMFTGNNAAAVAVDSAGEVIAAGRIDNDVTAEDFAVVKFAGATGAELWRREIDEAEGLVDRAMAVAVDAADDVVAGGAFGAGGGVEDYTVIKLAGASGTELWRYVRNGGGFSSDEVLAVAVDSAGDVVSAGYLDNGGSAGSDFDFAIVKLAGATGAELWRREINGTTMQFPFDLATSVALDGADDVIAAGLISNRNVFYERQDFAVVKVDGGTGAIEWQQSLQGAERAQNVVDTANAVAVDGSGRPIAVGFLTNPVSTHDFAVVRFGAIEGAVGPVRGSKLTVRDRSGDASAQALIGTADDQAIVAPAPGSGGDPTLFGATLRLVNPNTLETAVVALPAAHWTAVSAGGFQYRDRGASGPCTSVRVSPRKFIKARCTGGLGTIPFSLDEASQGTLALGLQLGSGDRQCIIMGGASVVRDVGIAGPMSSGVFRARLADPPSADCP